MTDHKLPTVLHCSLIINLMAISALLLGFASEARAQGPCGPPVVNAIACENSKPGNPATEWDVSGAGDASIQGFATDISANKGEIVRFKISTNASSYRLDIYRMGYYAGAGARKIASIIPSASLPQTQPACRTDSSTGLVDCGNWVESASWAVPPDAVSGIYFAKLVRTDTGGASHIVFIVRDDTGNADLLFQTSDTTWQAYNSYGGNSLYTGAPAGRAYKVSYNRPFNTRLQKPQSWVFNAEYPMVRWLEANGYNVSYFTGVDTDRRGAALFGHKVFVSVGHDEYWSAGQRANVEAARDAGLHLAFFSGNEVFWKTRWEASIDGSNTAYRTLVCYKETTANAKIDPTSVWTGTWRDPRFSPPADGGRPENALTGTLYMVNDGATSAITVPDTYATLPFWRNTRIATLAPNTKATFPFGTLGYEWDEAPANAVQPAGLTRLSSTTLNVPTYLLDYGSTYGAGTATHSLTLYRAPSGGLVFGAGTVQWSWGLDSEHDFGPSTTDLAMQQATVNLLADMAAQPATLQASLVAATQTCPCTIWNPAVIPAAASQSDTQAVEVGVRFRSNAAGYITGLRFYKGPVNTGTHVGNLWTSTGTLLATATFTGETSTGWQQVNLSAPVAVTANTTYVASYHTDVGAYAKDANYFATSGVDNSPLRALRDAEDGPNGVYQYGPGGFPTQTAASSNYWVDVVFNTTIASTNATLTITKTGTGTGTVTSSPAGIDCGSTCAASYANGTVVTLAAVAASQSVFVGWSGGCSGTSSCTVTTTADTTVTAMFLLKATTPTFNPVGGTYIGSQTVTMSTTTDGATIYYTTDGSAPTTASTVYTSPISITKTTTIAAIAAGSAMADSDVASATYSLKAIAPTFAPRGGTYVGSQAITLSTATTGATIYYTVDGATPTTGATIYSAPISIAKTTTIKAIAATNGMVDSDVVSATYTLQAVPPTFSLLAGTYVGSQTIALNTVTSGATIYYTVDGTTPTTGSTVYSAPISIAKTTTIEAIAAVNGMVDSDVVSATYTLQAVPPTFSLPAGMTYVGSQTIALSTVTSGATIYYTTDGSIPTTSSSAYTGPISIARTTTIRAIAGASQMLNSTVASAVYTLRAVPPMFNPPASTYTQPQTVALSTVTSGATIHFTTDDSTPTAASAVYTGPISVTRTTTIRAIATTSGMLDSTVASAAYILKVPATTFSPQGGTYLLPQMVQISDANLGATIYYTTDGSAPTTASTVYTDPILVITTTTIKAIAVAPGWSQSDIAAAKYTLPLQ